MPHGVIYLLCVMLYRLCIHSVWQWLSGSGADV